MLSPGCLSLLLNLYLSRNSWYLLYRPRKEERLSRPWNHLVVLNTGPLDWESSTLTTRPFSRFLTFSRNMSYFPTIMTFGTFKTAFIYFENDYPHNQNNLDPSYNPFPQTYCISLTPCLTLPFSLTQTTLQYRRHFLDPFHRRCNF